MDYLTQKGGMRGYTSTQSAAPLFAAEDTVETANKRCNMVRFDDPVFRLKRARFLKNQRDPEKVFRASRTAYARTREYRLESINKVRDLYGLTEVVEGAKITSDFICIRCELETFLVDGAWICPHCRICQYLPAEEWRGLREREVAGLERLQKPVEWPEPDLYTPVESTLRDIGIDQSMMDTGQPYPTTAAFL